MQGDEHHQRACERQMHIPERRAPETGRQRALVEKDDLRQARLQRHRQAAERQTDRRDVEQPVREPGHVVQQPIAGRRISGPGRAGS
jgi:hypothetical protein